MFVMETVVSAVFRKVCISCCVRSTFESNTVSCTGLVNDSALEVSRPSEHGW